MENKLPDIPKTLLKWTPQAIECYNRKCKCEGCFIYETIETTCKMKYVVLELYKISPPTTYVELNKKLKDI